MLTGSLVDWLDPQNLLDTQDWEHIFGFYFHDLGYHFGTLGPHFGGLGMPGVAQQATLGSRDRFLMIFNGFGVPIWSPVWSIFEILGPLDPPIAGLGSQGRFFKDL